MLHSRRAYAKASPARANRKAAAGGSDDSGSQRLSSAPGAAAAYTPLEDRVLATYHAPLESVMPPGSILASTRPAHQHQPRHATAGAGGVAAAGHRLVVPLKPDPELRAALQELLAQEAELGAALRQQLEKGYSPAIRGDVSKRDALLEELAEAGDPAAAGPAADSKALQRAAYAALQRLQGEAAAAGRRQQQAAASSTVKFPIPTIGINLLNAPGPGPAPAAVAAPAVAAAAAAAPEPAKVRSRSRGKKAKKEDLPPDHGMIEILDPTSLHCSAAMYQGTTAEWHAQHAAQVKGVVGHSPSLDPTLELFYCQLQLEAKGRALALRAAQEDASKKLKAQRVQDAATAKELVGAWTQQLMGVLQQQVAKFLELKIEADTQELRAQAQYVPFIMGLPAEMLARGVLLSILNHVLATGHGAGGTDKRSQPGQVLSMDCADLLGRIVMDMVSYIEVCRRVDEKRAEVRRAGSKLRKAQKDAAASEEGPLDAEVHQAAELARNMRVQLLRLKDVATALEPESMAIGRGATDQERRAAKARLVYLRKVAIDAVDLALRVQDWDQPMRIRVGAGLLSLAIQTLQVYDPESGCLEPAFSHSTSAGFIEGQHSYTTPGFVVVHDRVMDVLAGSTELRHLVLPKALPMVVEPRPWTGTHRGGYLTVAHPVMKTRYSQVLIKELRAAHEQGRLQQLYDGLNCLGNVPWRINERVLRVMTHVYETGMSCHGIPLAKKRPLPPSIATALNEAYKPYLAGEASKRGKAAKGSSSSSSIGGGGLPAECGTPFLRLQREGATGGQLLISSGASSAGELRAYTRMAKDVRRLDKTETAQRAVLGYQLGLAHLYVPPGGLQGGRRGPGRRSKRQQQEEQEQEDAYVGSSIFYQPHQIDFRGRAYPIHPHLNHLAHDSGRALLQFGEGVPLGPKGFDWLLVQAANCWGQSVDKEPLPQRRAWAARHMQQLLQSAANPLEQSWWQQAEKPWQLLAAAFEIAGAVGSGDIEGYVSHQPVHQDGSCNGLQHYAAIARDAGCGAAVNLLPSDAPQDVYQAVADVVADRVRRDAAAGRSEAVKCDGLVNRKLVKQTVMTYVYGVTTIGAREQIEARLEERKWGNARERRKAATYLASLTFSSLGDVFGPAVAVRKWLADCAAVICTTNQPVAWTTAMGVPSQQPYRSISKVVVTTPLQKFSQQCFDDEAERPIDKRKQRSGFPPNYIHSLDGSHMVATAIAMRREGWSFASVHDSFWTHAAHVDDMNRLIREKFVELHSRPLLAELHRELTSNPLYEAVWHKIPELPTQGQLDITKVKESTYFFS